MASACSASMSIPFPFPSSPHWAPTTTIPGIGHQSRAARGHPIFPTARVDIPDGLGLYPTGLVCGCRHRAAYVYSRPTRRSLMSAGGSHQGGNDCMIILGLILLIIGLVAAIPILWTIGVVLVLVGLVLVALGAMGRAVGGRRHYY